MLVLQGAGGGRTVGKVYVQWLGALHTGIRALPARAGGFLILLVQGRAGCATAGWGVDGWAAAGLPDPVAAAAAAVGGGHIGGSSGFEQQLLNSFA